MKINISREWCSNMAKLEGDQEIGVGPLSAEPLNISMTSTELQRIKARVTATICETWRGEHDGHGNMISVIEGRISADDFMTLCAMAEIAVTLNDAARTDEQYNALLAFIREWMARGRIAGPDMRAALRDIADAV